MNNMQRLVQLNKQWNDAKRELEETRSTICRLEMLKIDHKRQILAAECRLREHIRKTLSPQPEPNSETL